MPFLVEFPVTTDHRTPDLKILYRNKSGRKAEGEVQKSSPGQLQIAGEADSGDRDIQDLRRSFLVRFGPLIIQIERLVDRDSFFSPSLRGRESPWKLDFETQDSHDADNEFIG